MDCVQDHVVALTALLSRWFPFMGLDRACCCSSVSSLSTKPPGPGDAPSSVLSFDAWILLVTSTLDDLVKQVFE
jgi:hypothetical protein